MSISALEMMQEIAVTCIRNRPQDFEPSAEHAVVAYLESRPKEVRMNGARPETTINYIKVVLSRHEKGAQPQAYS